MGLNLDRLDPFRPPSLREILKAMPHWLYGKISTGPGLEKHIVNDQLIIRLQRGLNMIGGLQIEEVATLPAIPTAGGKLVFWYSDTYRSGGTGDDQIWCAYAGQTKWYRLQKYSALSGEVV